MKKNSSRRLALSVLLEIVVFDDIKPSTIKNKIYNFFIVTDIPNNATKER